MCPVLLFASLATTNLFGSIYNYSKFYSIIFFLLFSILMCLSGRTVFSSKNGNSPGTSLGFHPIKLFPSEDMRKTAWTRNRWVPVWDGLYVYYKNERL